MVVKCSQNASSRRSSMAGEFLEDLIITQSAVSFAGCRSGEWGSGLKGRSRRRGGNMKKTGKVQELRLTFSAIRARNADTEVTHTL